MRFTCCCSTSGRLNVLFTARFSNSSSGMLLQRKNDRRDARSRSLMRYGVLTATFGGWLSILKRNFGLIRMLRSAISMPASNPPLAAPPRYAVRGAWRSSSVTGRRYARRARFDTIVLAQISSLRDEGAHVRMRRRLGVSPIEAVAGCGPVIVTLEIFGLPLPSRYGSRRNDGSNRSSTNAVVFDAKYTCTRRVPDLIGRRKVSNWRIFFVRSSRG